MPTIRVLHHTSAVSIESLRGEFPEVEFIPVPTDGAIDPDIEGDVLFTSVVGAPNLSEALARGVRWVHGTGTGVDRFPLHEIRPGQVLTCSRGASATPIAEWCLATMLANAKCLPDAWIHQPPNFAARPALRSLRGSRLGVLGLGSIGLETARLAIAFGMHVRGLRRTARPSPIDGIEMAIDAAATIDDADHIVVAAPLTSDTHHLVDAALLGSVKPGVHIVNIARGSIIDQDALRVALDTPVGNTWQVGMASLDVVTPEPLPDGHWLYSHPRVRLSPHVSWITQHSYDQLGDAFRHNLRRFLRGDDLEGVVDTKLGY